jgi:DNA adenine methylase
MAILAYIGGKNRLAAKIAAKFPDHVTYVEPFAGGAQVFFHKEPSRVEVLNDLNQDIVNLFRVCQAHHEELARYLKFSLVSRKWFELLEAQTPESLTDIQRAARFVYLQKNAFAGLVRNRSFHYSVANPPGFRPDKLAHILEETHRRLARVQIECLPYEEILRRYDRPDTLFYMDPPYFGRQLYAFNFFEQDFRDLAARLHQLRGKFVLSLNDVPEVREIFQDFEIEAIDVPYTSQRKAVKRFREVLIRNHA